jgi:hypothetical protein
MRYSPHGESYGAWLGGGANYIAIDLSEGLIAMAMSTASQDLELIREGERLFNFLKKYDLHQYHTKFLHKGVHRLTHLKGVLADEASLDEIGLSRIERNRLRSKVKENVTWRGKLVVSKQLAAGRELGSWIG